ncbi:clp ATPase, partial [Yersinia pestis PY-92]
MNTFLPT